MPNYIIHNGAKERHRPFLQMLKITLDTTNIIDYFERDKTYISPIIDLANLGKLDLAITTRVPIDLMRDKDEFRRNAILEQLNRSKEIRTIGAPFRLDMSFLDSGDFVIGDDEAKWIKEIETCLFPSLAMNSKRLDNKLCDCDHLAAHILSKRDVFLTTDNNYIDKMGRLNIIQPVSILTPREFIEKMVISLG